MTGNLILRKMTAQDIPAVAEVERTSFSDAWSLNLIADLLKSDWDQVWILQTEEGKVFAYGNFRFLAGEGELMRIAVLPEFRGKGASRLLMDRFFLSAGETQAKELTLEVRDSNTAAIHLYESYGFQTEAIRKNYYRDPVEDARIMWRR